MQAKKRCAEQLEPPKLGSWGLLREITRVNPAGRNGRARYGQGATSGCSGSVPLEQLAAARDSRRKNPGASTVRLQRMAALEEDRRKEAGQDDDWRRDDHHVRRRIDVVASRHGGVLWRAMERRAT